MANAPATIEFIAVGPRQDMVAEFAAFDLVAAGVLPARAAKYLVMPVGNAEWDTEGFASRQEAYAAADDLAARYKVKAVKLNRK